MLTFIMLVVLAGGIGLLVVSLAESSKPTAEGPGPERADDTASTDDPAGQPAPDDVPEAPPSGDGLAPPPLVVAPAPAPPAPPRAYDPGPPRRRRIPADVPRSQVALEGRYADVAHAPVWRRVVAVVGIAGITVLSGVVIAAVLAAGIAAGAELLNTAIG